MAHIKEKDIEEAIQNSLISSGFAQSVSSDFDRKSCINKIELFRFLETTQSELLEEFKKFRPTNWEEKLLDMIDTNIKQKGLIRVLREGVEDYSLSSNLRLVYFKPNNNKNQETLKLYNSNIFSLTRQLYFEESAKTSIDLVVFLNGFPIVVIELKNKFTGQNIENGKEQFKLDRSYRSKLSEFNTRTLIYFAVYNDEVSMTTQLKGEDTFFLPFNKGFEQGAGNPIVEGKFRTYYLWEEILLQDSLLDIFRNFYFIQEDEKDPNKKIAIFPRYHQLDVVKKVEKKVKEEKQGKKYLIQHSAGSGKTNSISWLAHRLSKLHDEDENLIFDSVIVITDRKVLDKQLQDAIYQLDKTKGIVVKIDKNKNSNDLALALQKKAKIIITTIQKFAYAYKKIDSLDKNNYAIIIDEAHSSTSGENINYLKLSLSGKDLDEAKEFDKKYETNSEDDVNKMLEAITDTRHLSFFAFTATPKDKTMQIFGRVGDDGKPHEFHLYSMRQAIEEGFILDPLKNYMISDTYFKIGKKIKDNPIFEKRGANKAIGSFINLHEHNIKQKVETIVEDFMTNRVFWLKNRAKAMVVTSSRLHALKYKLAFDEYLATHYPSVKSLIAFSGELEIDEVKYTEESLNAIKESELPEVFDSVDSIKFLIVADKYQTGFDQPKLCAMYVDKMLNGVTAVQTLSRLNRVTKNKDNTFVLDFVNDVDTIRDSFSRYYTSSNIEEMTDPNIVFEFYHKIDEFHICYEEEVKEYCKLYLKEQKNSNDIANMDNLVNVAIERFKKIKEIEKQDEFKTYVIKFFRAYNFLIQIYPIKKTALYEMYIYLGGLIKKFPKDMISKVELDNLLSLDFYKLKRMNGDETNGEDISLQKGDEKDLKGFSSGGSRKKEKEEVDLNSLIQIINDLFGLDLSDEDRLAFFDQPLEAHKQNEDLKDIAIVNSYEEFEEQFKKGYFLKMILDKRSTNEEIFNKIFTDNSFKSYLVENMSKELYRHFNS
ncbi:type I restriction endonuclease subunit R [Aliarcobacter butzleri]|uniref:type I restriction endonuclease subunit R n=1 Tax=Aliarcobacter butzleri TaxID=28197 RepID=UPI0012F8531D|nr:DEAD/DEAH box helicase family protein [Aliarcobacter butzleri]